MKPLRLVYFGTADFAVPPLEALLQNPDKFEVLAVVTRPDQPVGRQQVLQACPVAHLARKTGLQTFTPRKIKKNEEFLAALNDLAADFFVVAAYGKILPQRLLDMPKLGPVNLHGSILPAYRGASPIQAAIADGQTETGISLMVMDAEMDHGGVFSVEKVRIAPDDTHESLERKMGLTAAGQLVRDLPSIAAGDLKPQEQEHDQAAFTKIIKKEDGLADWSLPAASLANLLRAYTPWPGLYTVWQRRSDKSLRLTLKEVEALPTTEGAPGTVSKTADGYPAVTTANGTLKLLTVQAEGKRPMSGKDFLNGYRDLIGSQLQ